jgi:protein-disulfide isomerase
MENLPVPPEKEPEDTVVFKRSHFYSVMVVFAFAVGILVGYVAWGRETPAQPAAVAAAPAQAAAPAGDPSYTRYDIPTEGYPSLGPEDAEIVLVEFSDFGCSFCAKWHNETYEKLLASYPGKIRFVYRNLPFRAFPAAEAAMCANEQNAYWLYHDKLFSYQYGLAEEAFIQYAEDLNLDIDAFSTCLDEHRYQDFVQEDMNFAIQLGINGTPTFFVNGLPIIGAQPLESFKDLIDRELAGEFPE